MSFNVTPISTLGTPPYAAWNAPVGIGGLLVASICDINTYSTDVFATSADGQIWTQRALPGYGEYSRPVVGGGVAVMVNKIGLTTTAGLRSTDGINWSFVTLPQATSWDAVIYGGGLFAALRSGSTVAATSSNGSSWTQRTLPVSTFHTSSAYFAGRFLAFYASSYLTSTNGIDWEQKTLKTGLTELVFTAVVCGSYLIVVPRNKNYFLRSTDGLVWEELSLPRTGWWTGGDYGGGTILIVDSGNMASTILASDDFGATWYDIDIPDMAYLSALSYSEDLQAFITLSLWTPDGLFIQKATPFWTNSRGQREVL